MVGGGTAGREVAKDNGESVRPRIIVFGKGTIVRSFIYSFRTRNKMSFESINMFCGLQLMIVVGSMFITSLAERERERERKKERRSEQSIPSCMCIVEL